MSDWKPTACIICSLNCGLRIQTEGRRITAIRGDKDHPASRGYLCEKARALDHYQNGRDRLSAPMRRREDGSFEAVDWDTAITEVAARLAAVRDTHGGEKIFYYGGGAQGNHLGGAYGRATRAALGSVYTSNALAQEKTGEFWVDGQLYGRARCHTTPDFDHAQVAVFVGKNPWHSHGFPRARAVLKEIAKDPDRSMIVIDPRRTKTARLADIHLQLRPGTDAWLLTALLAITLEEGLANDDWLAEHASGLAELRALVDVDISAYCAHADVPEELVREAARLMAGAESMSILEDLGIQQGHHSTLCSWLEKALYLLSGNFAKRGGMNIHTRFASLGGGKGSRRKGSPVGDHRIIGGLVPCNVIADEILTDHPDRFRAMIVESSNPVHSLADSGRMREALRALEFVVVIDVAMTETALEADYVLPASSQFEKWEMAFFNLEFPHNVAQLRPPALEPLDGTLPEPEIHARLVRELGALDDFDLSMLHTSAADGLDAYAFTFGMAAMADPRMMRLAPAILYETLGPHLPAGAAATSAIWGLCQQIAMTYPDSVKRAGIDGDGPLLGNALFRAVIDNPSGVVFTDDPYEETWNRVETGDRRVNLVVPALVEELKGLATMTSRADADYPFVLAAGERRSGTANVLFRDPTWRKAGAGALRISEEDAASLGLESGMSARVTTRTGSVVAPVEVSDTMRSGHVSLPNGHGVSYPDADGVVQTHGVAVNELTSTQDRDPIAGTPWHKHVPARIEPVGASDIT
jgi:anaerobic selenocysteine-containing dehydrogenase